MTDSDEEAFSQLVCDKYPGVVFVDDNVWPTSTPRTRARISDCETSFAFIWNRAITASLPVSQRGDGQWEGPIVGPVIQFVRSRELGNLLLSGRIATGYDSTDEDMKGFTQGVFKVLKSFATNKLSVIDVVTREPLRAEKRYFAGPDAVASVASKFDFFRNRSVNEFYLPAPT